MGALKVGRTLQVHLQVSQRSPRGALCHPPACGGCTHPGSCRCARDQPRSSEGSGFRTRSRACSPSSGFYASSHQLETAPVPRLHPPETSASLSPWRSRCSRVGHDRCPPLKRACSDLGQRSVTGVAVQTQRGDPGRHLVMSCCITSIRGVILTDLTGLEYPEFNLLKTYTC